MFPIWGTCLGFEMLALMGNDGQPYRKACLSVDQALPLDLLPGWEDSELLAPVPHTLQLLWLKKKGGGMIERIAF